LRTASAPPAFVPARRDFGVATKRGGERPESGAVYTETVEQECARLGTGRLVTLIGRFWSLDREENWDRIEKTYRALVEGRGEPVRAVN